MTTLAAFGIGGWEVLLIALILGGMIGVLLLVAGIVIFVSRRQQRTKAQQEIGN
jgi:Tfp pilus assembly protein PilW